MTLENGIISNIRILMGRGLLLLFVVWLCSCSTSGADGDDNPVTAGTGTISGAVTDSEGHPYQGVVITATKGTSISSATTNTTGSYSITTKDVGDHSVSITVPLPTTVSGQSTHAVSVLANQNNTVNFELEPQPLTAELVFGIADIFGQIEDKDGNIPVADGTEIYAANCSMPLLGYLHLSNPPKTFPLPLASGKRLPARLKYTVTALTPAWQLI